MKKRLTRTSTLLVLLVALPELRQGFRAYYKVLSIFSEVWELQESFLSEIFFRT